MSHPDFITAIDELTAEIDKLQDLLVKLKQRVEGLGIDESDDQVRRQIDSQFILCVGKLAEFQDQYQKLIKSKNPGYTRA
ncbi:hypothetical protein [Xanthocytophaga flava]|uniref:hypothetical protein n=1 Tax=Xanthocytophaga flava TaxID=3048013 RepID=UPI0028D04900|nr:hypothetical protein [Xanthocytophaga flavus]MDJ1472867.1 hypothetical protein [Xanthocytophaga flavus]